eukprot:Rmarinus@m.19524
MMAVPLLCTLLWVGAVHSFPVENGHPISSILLDEDPIPLEHAYGHADQKSWVDYLRAGFCSIEVDIHQVEDDLMVGHYCNRIPMCVDSLLDEYLIPILETIRMNDGYVYKQTHTTGLCKTFTFMQDSKTNGNNAVDILNQWLDILDEEYPGYITRWVDGEIVEGPLTIVMTGNQPSVEKLEAMKVRRMAKDGGFNADGFIDGHEDGRGASMFPWIHASYQSIFPGLSTSLDDEQVQLLSSITEKAHSIGQKVRIYATPHRTELWTQLLEAGQDVINTDLYNMLAKFLIDNGYVYNVESAQETSMDII